MPSRERSPDSRDAVPVTPDAHGHDGVLTEAALPTEASEVVAVDPDDACRRTGRQPALHGLPVAQDLKRYQRRLFGLHGSSDDVRG
jgi:hypothetical protein